MGAAILRREGLLKDLLGTPDRNVRIGKSQDGNIRGHGSILMV